MPAATATETTERLRSAGLRVTAQRIRLFDVLAGARDERSHLSADDIYWLLAETGESIGVGTIYRILGEFEENGLVNRVSFDDAKALYELTDRGAHSHMYRVDTREIIEFTDSLLDRRQRRIVEQRGLEIVGYRLILFVKQRDSH